MIFGYDGSSWTLSIPTAIEIRLVQLEEEKKDMIRTGDEL
jgi:hypothetical protein